MLYKVYNVHIMYIRKNVRYKLYITFVRSEISDQYCYCIISFFLYSWDRPDDGYKTVAETCSWFIK
jgi:hypothetical protein